MPPPSLSAQSAEKMAAVVEAAQDLVDGGENPDEAIAKSARDKGLPLGHIHKVVHAFNTARAVQQLSQGDVWTKASGYPVADADRVVKVLTRDCTPAKAASVADYAFPPNFKLEAETVFTRDTSPTVKEAKCLTPEPMTDKRMGNVYGTDFRAAKLADDLAAALKKMDDADYSAVRHFGMDSVETKLAAEFVFPALEAELPDLAKKAKATPSYKVKSDHLVFQMLGELQQIKMAYPRTEPTAAPEGYVKIHSEFGYDLYEKRAAEHKPVDLGLTLPEPKKATFAETILRIPEKMAAEAAPDPKPNPKPDVPEPTGSVLGSFGKSPLKMFQAAKANPLLSPVTSGLSMMNKKPEEGVVQMPPGLAKQKETFAANMGRLDQQSAVQDLLADPRFTTADPKQLIQTYQELSSIAPQSMRNPAIASDYIARKLHTGPLSYFDLEKLVGIEKSLAQIQRWRDESDPDDING